MTALWVDYSAGRPGGAALQGAGITGALRYISAGSAGKLITAAEYADLIAHGLQVLLVYELNTHDAEGGYTQGVAHAQAALSTARAYGIPDSVGIAAAADEHLTAAQVTCALAYIAGFVSVLGLGRTGAYGPAELIDAVHANNAAGWTWKWGTAPSTAERAWLTFWQRNAGQTTQVIGGVTCDLNEVINPMGATMTNPFTGNSANAPILDENGNYTGTDAPNPTNFADDERFTNASVRWLIEDWVPKVNAALTAIQTAQVPSQLTGTASVTVSLAPPAKSA